MKSTRTFSSELFQDKIDKARMLLSDADRIIVGAGAGLSASGGLDYADPSLVEKWFPEYYLRGFRSIPEIQSVFWRIEDSDPELYWGYWAQHIFHVRYEPSALEPYRSLFKILSGRDFFICTTNVDGQFGKAGFTDDRIFAPQGDYALFQCSLPCRDEVFDNRGMVNAMIQGITSDDFPRVRNEDIPFCPHCGRKLKPNLRSDDTFVETPHYKNLESYQNYISQSIPESIKTVLLDLGTGYNTPGIIRFPFEQLTERSPAMSLIRINRDHADIPSSIEDQSVSIAADIGDVLKAFL